MKNHSLIPSKKSSRSVRKSHGKLAFGLAAMASLSLGSAFAQAVTWTLTPANNYNQVWTTGSSWARTGGGGAVPVSGSDTTLVFGGSYAGATTITSKNDNGAVGTPFELNVLTLGAQNSTNYTAVNYNIQPLNSATNTLAFVSNGATAPTVNLNSNQGGYGNAVNNTVSINASIAGVLTFQGSGAGASNAFTGVFSDGASAGSIVKNGYSSLTLSGSNTFTGGLTMNAGVLNISNAYAVGTGTLTLAGGKIDNITAAAITLANNNEQAWNGNFTFGGTRALNLGTGAVTLGANVEATVGGNATTALTVAGPISGTGKSLTKLGSGTLILSGSNSYDGGTIINGGVLQFTNADAIGGSGANLTVNTGGVAAFGYELDQTTLSTRLVASSKGTVALTAANAQNLDFSAAGLSNLSLGAVSGTFAYSGNLTPAGGTYRLGGGGGTLLFNSSLTGANSLVVGGGGSGGTVTLAQAASHSGGTTVVGAIWGNLGGQSVLKTNVLEGSSTTPFGSGAITLNYGVLGLGTAGALSTGDVINVVGNDVAFIGLNSVGLTVGGGSSVTLAANTLTRGKAGVLLINPTSGATLGNTEKVTVASGAPTPVNGMVSPYYINGTTKNFLTYGANGFQDITPTKTGTNALPTGLVSTDNVLVNETGNSTTFTSFGNLAINSLKIANTAGSNGNQVLGNGANTLSILSGGLILNWTAGNGNFSGATLNFGTSEALVGVFGGGPTIGNRINGTGGFTVYGTSPLTVSNLQTTGGINISGGSTLLLSANMVNSFNPNNIVTIAKGGVLGSNANARPAQMLGLEGEGAVLWNSTVGGGNGGSNTYTVDGLTSTGTSTFGGSILDSGGNQNLFIVKSGLNTQVLSGASTYIGTTTVNGGTLRLDFSASGAPASNILNNLTNSSALTLAGGKLDIVGAAGSTNSQRFPSLSLGAGSNEIAVTQGAGGTASVVTGTSLSRSTGATLNIVDATGGHVSSLATLPVSNGILVSSGTVAYATLNGTDWAVNSGGALTALASYSTGVDNYTATNNVDVTDSDSVTGVTVNTLRFNSATDALTLSGNNIVSSGGVLVTPASTAASMTGGTIKSGIGKELVLINNGQLTVGTQIVDSASGASALTLSGSGVTTLRGANTYTGSTYINSGTVVLENATALGTTAGTLYLKGGTLQSGTAAITLNAKPITLSDNFTISGSNNLTLSGAFTNNRNYNTLTVNNTGLTTLSGNLSLGTGFTFNVAGTGNITASGVLSTTGGLNYAGSGVMTLSGSASTYTGVTRVSSGTLSVSALTNELTATTYTTGSGNSVITVPNTAGLVIGQTVAASGIPAGTTISSISGSSVTLSAAATSTVTSVTGTFGTASNSSIGASSSAAGNLVLDGGALQYAGTGGSTNRAFSVGAKGGTLDASGSGAVTFSNIGTIGYDNTPGDRTLTLTGANTGNNTLAASIGDYLDLYKTSLTKSGAGTWVLTGSSSYTGNTTITSGTLSIGASSALGNTAKIDVRTGGTLDLTALSSFAVSGSQTLQSTGVGTVNAPAGGVTVSGIAAPGGVAVTGTLNVVGSLTLAGITQMEISKSGGDTLSDLLLADTLTLGGTLNVTALGDTLVGGESFILFSTNTGSFSAINLPGLADGLSWDTSHLSDGLLMVVVPEPATWAMLVGGLGMLAFSNRLRRNRRM